MIEFFLSLSLLINFLLIFRFFFNKPLLFILSFLPLVQCILVFLRFKIINIDYDDPTLNFPISSEIAFENSLYLSILIFVIVIPILILLKKSKFYIFNLNYDEILSLSKPYYPLVVFFASSYPLWVFTQEFYKNSFIDNSIALIIRLFGSAWFFVPYLPNKYKIIIFTIFISSLPLAFSDGNRTCFIYPLILFLSNIFLQIISNYRNIFKNFKSIFKTIFLTFSFSLFVSAILIISIFIRLNREVKGFDLNVIYSRILDLDIGNNLIIIAFSQTFDRLIQWQIFTSFEVDKIFLSNFFEEFFLIFKPQRYDWDYILNNSIGLGLPQLMGIQPTGGYSWPVTILAEGAVRFGHLGSILYYILFLITLIITILIAKRLSIKPFFITLNFLSATLINFNSDSFPQYIKTSMQFIFVSLIFYFLYKLSFTRLEINK